MHTNFNLLGVVRAGGVQPSAMAQVPADSFPDLHHKMSKKIAQLTKVIYHLNTKNDMHDAEVQGVQDLYESEIDEIIRDAHAKLASFATRLNDSGAQQTQLLEQLRRQLEDERKRAANEAAAMQRRCAEQTEVRG